MDVKEALRKELIFPDETETLDAALDALIETRRRLDEYYKHYRVVLEKAKTIQHLVQDTEVLVRYGGPTNKIPVEATIHLLDSFIKELEELFSS